MGSGIDPGPTGGETLEELVLQLETYSLNAAEYPDLATAHTRTKLMQGIARLRAEVGHLRAAITTPEVYFGVISDVIVEDYERQGAELRTARAEVERLRMVDQGAGDECPDCGWNGVRGSEPCVFCAVERLTAERNRAQGRANENAEAAREYVARANAAEARAARLEEELTVERDYWHERADEWEAEGDGSEATFALQHAERIHRALNREGGEHGR